MKIQRYLIIDSQNGKCKLRQRPDAGFGEYTIRLKIDIPEPVIPSITIDIPLPETAAMRAEVKDIPYGVPWALAEGIMEIKSVSPDGKLQLDYTDAGLQRLYDKAKPRPAEGWWAMAEYARKVWGLPDIYMEYERWGKLFPAEEGDDAAKELHD
jgi:hypothetical protein